MKNFFEIEPKVKGEAEEKKHPDYDLIAGKLLISRGTTTEEFGSPNVYQAAVKLYAALYHPEEVKDFFKPSDKFPDRMVILQKALSNKIENIPDKEEFVNEIRKAMVKEVDFGECLSAEAREQFRKMMEKSEHTVIWTDGDAQGVPEFNLPGSIEQLRKIATAQFYNKARKEVAQERGVKRSDVLSIEATEGKMKLVPQIVKRFNEMGIKKIVIIEDRVKNLIKAMDLIKNTDPKIDIFPVWIRVGQFRDKIESGKSLEEWIAELHAIENISQLSEILEQNQVFGDKKVGSIFDLDGPLHDDKRKKIQTESVIKKLQEKGWI